MNIVRLEKLLAVTISRYRITSSKDEVYLFSIVNKTMDVDFRAQLQLFGR